MVNLTFYRLDVSYLINPDNSEAQHSSISIFHFPSAGRSFMLEFLRWSSKYHLIWCFPNASVILVICCSDFVFQERSSFSLILRVNQFDFRWSWIMIRFAGCCLVSWWIFSNNRGRPFRSRPLDLFELFGFFLIDPADSVYFCAFVLFWLEIRLITIVSICFW